MSRGSCCIVGELKSWLSGKTDPRLGVVGGPPGWAQPAAMLVDIRGLTVEDAPGVERTIGGSGVGALKLLLGASACHFGLRGDPKAGVKSVGEFDALGDDMGALAKAECGFLKGEGSILEDTEERGRFLNSPCGSLGTEEKSLDSPT